MFISVSIGSALRRTISTVLAIIIAAQSAFAFLPEQNRWDRHAPPSQQSPIVVNNRIALLDALHPFVRLKSTTTDGQNRSQTVYLLEDVHMHEEVQRHIAEALRILSNATNVNREALLVGIEGSVGAFDFGPFDLLANRAAIEAAADKMLAKSQIGGAVYAALTSKPISQRIRVEGIEEPILYQKNIEAYRRTLTSQASVLATVQNETQIVQRKISENFAESDAEFLRFQYAYHQKRIPLLEYLQRMHAEIPERPISFSLDSLRRSLLLESTFARLQTPQQRDHLKQRLVSDPHLREIYADAISAANGFDENTFTEAVTTVETQIARHLTRNHQQATTLRRIKRLELLRKLTDFSLTPKEWMEFQQRGSGRFPPAFNAALRPYEDFYACAVARNDQLADRFIELFKQRRNASGALIVGGFHSNQVKRRLEMAGLNVVVLTPIISKPPTVSGRAYLKIFLAPAETIGATDSQFDVPAFRTHASLNFAWEYFKKTEASDGINLLRCLWRLIFKRAQTFSPAPGPAAARPNVIETDSEGRILNPQQVINDAPKNEALQNNLYTLKTTMLGALSIYFLFYAHCDFALANPLVPLAIGVYASLILPLWAFLRPHTQVVIRRMGDFTLRKSVTQPIDLVELTKGHVLFNFTPTFPYLVSVYTIAALAPLIETPEATLVLSVMLLVHTVVYLTVAPATSEAWHRAWTESSLRRNGPAAAGQRPRRYFRSPPLTLPEIKIDTFLQNAATNSATEAQEQELLALRTFAIPLNRYGYWALGDRNKTHISVLGREALATVRKKADGTALYMNILYDDKIYQRRLAPGLPAYGNPFSKYLLPFYDYADQVLNGSSAEETAASAMALVKAGSLTLPALRGLVRFGRIQHNRDNHTMQIALPETHKRTATVTVTAHFINETDASGGVLIRIRAGSDSFDFDFNELLPIKARKALSERSKTEIRKDHDQVISLFWESVRAALIESKQITTKTPLSDWKTTHPERAAALQNAIYWKTNKTYRVAPVPTVQAIVLLKRLYLIAGGDLDTPWLRPFRDLVNVDEITRSGAMRKLIARRSRAKRAYIASGDVLTNTINPRGYEKSSVSAMRNMGIFEDDDILELRAASDDALFLPFWNSVFSLPADYSDDFVMKHAAILELWMLPGFGLGLITLFYLTGAFTSEPLMSVLRSIATAGVLTSVLHGLPTVDDRAPPAFRQSVRQFLARLIGASLITSAALMPLALNLSTGNLAAPVQIGIGLGTVLLSLLIGVFAHTLWNQTAWPTWELSRKVPLRIPTTTELLKENNVDQQIASEWQRIGGLLELLAAQKAGTDVEVLRANPVALQNALLALNEADLTKTRTGGEFDVKPKLTTIMHALSAAAKTQGKTGRWLLFEKVGILPTLPGMWDVTTPEQFGELFTSQAIRIENVSWKELATRNHVLVKAVFNRLAADKAGLVWNEQTTQNEITAVQRASLQRQDFNATIPGTTISYIGLYNAKIPGNETGAKQGTFEVDAFLRFLGWPTALSLIETAYRQQDIEGLRESSLLQRNWTLILEHLPKPTSRRIAHELSVTLGKPILKITSRASDVEATIPLIGRSLGYIGRAAIKADPSAKLPTERFRTMGYVFTINDLNTLLPRVNALYTGSTADTATAPLIRRLADTPLSIDDPKTLAQLRVEIEQAMRTLSQQHQQLPDASINSLLDGLDAYCALIDSVLWMREAFVETVRPWLENPENLKRIPEVASLRALMESIHSLKPADNPYAGWPPLPTGVDALRPVLAIDWESLNKTNPEYLKFLVEELVREVNRSIRPCLSPLQLNQDDFHQVRLSRFNGRTLSGLYSFYDNESKSSNKNTRWLLLARIGYIAETLPSLADIKTGRDLKLLLDAGAITSVPWLILAKSNPRLIRHVLAELVVTVKRQTSGDADVILKEAKRVTDEDISKLLSVDFYHTLPTYGKQLNNLLRALNYVRRPSAGQKKTTSPIEAKAPVSAPADPEADNSTLPFVPWDASLRSESDELPFIDEILKAAQKNEPGSDEVATEPVRAQEATAVSGTATPPMLPDSLALFINNFPTASALRKAGIKTPAELKAQSPRSLKSKGFSSAVIRTLFLLLRPYFEPAELDLWEREAAELKINLIYVSKPRAPRAGPVLRPAPAVKATPKPKAPKSIRVPPLPLKPSAPALKPAPTKKIELPPTPRAPAQVLPETVSEIASKPTEISPYLVLAAVRAFVLHGSGYLADKAMVYLLQISRLNPQSVLNVLTEFGETSATNEVEHGEDRSNKRATRTFRSLIPGQEFIAVLTEWAADIVKTGIMPDANVYVLPRFPVEILSEEDVPAEDTRGKEDGATPTPNHQERAWNLRQQAYQEKISKHRDALVVPEGKTIDDLELITRVSQIAELLVEWNLLFDHISEEDMQADADVENESLPFSTEINNILTNPNYFDFDAWLVPPPTGVSAPRARLIDYATAPLRTFAATDRYHKQKEQLLLQKTVALVDSWILDPDTFAKATVEFEKTHRQLAAGVLGGSQNVPIVSRVLLAAYQRGSRIAAGRGSHAKNGIRFATPSPVSPTFSLESTIAAMRKAADAPDAATSAALLDTLLIDAYLWSSLTAESLSRLLRGPAAAEDWSNEDENRANAAAQFLALPSGHDYMTALIRQMRRNGRDVRGDDDFALIFRPSMLWAFVERWDAETNPEMKVRYANALRRFTAVWSNETKTEFDRAISEKLTGKYEPVLRLTNGKATLDSTERTLTRWSKPNSGRLKQWLVQHPALAIALIEELGMPTKERSVFRAWAQSRWPSALLFAAVATSNWSGPCTTPLLVMAGILTMASQIWFVREHRPTRWGSASTATLVFNFSASLAAFIFGTMFPSSPWTAVAGALLVATSEHALWIRYRQRPDYARFVRRDGATFWARHFEIYDVSLDHVETEINEAVRNSDGRLVLATRSQILRDSSFQEHARFLLEDPVDWPNSDQAELQLLAQPADAEVKIGVGGLLRVKIGDRYLLERNPKTGVCKPLGGALQFDEAGRRQLEQLGATRFWGAGNDIRCYIKASRWRDFERWLLTRQGRETDALRELVEELTLEHRLVDPVLLSDALQSSMAFEQLPAATRELRGQVDLGRAEPFVNALHQVAISIAEKAASRLLQIRNVARLSQVTKNDGTPKSIADDEATDLAVRLILSAFPEHHIVIEEDIQDARLNNLNDRNAASDYQWYIDPLDGTREYLGLGSTWAFQLVLLYKGIPVVAVVVFPEIQNETGQSQLISMRLGHSGITVDATSTGHAAQTWKRNGRLVVNTLPHSEGFPNRSIEHWRSAGYDLRTDGLASFVVASIALKRAGLEPAQHAADVYARRQPFAWDILPPSALIWKLDGQVVHLDSGRDIFPFVVSSNDQRSRLPTMVAGDAGILKEVRHRSGLPVQIESSPKVETRAIASWNKWRGIVRDAKLNSLVWTAIQDPDANNRIQALRQLIAMSSSERDLARIFAWSSVQSDAAEFMSLLKEFLRSDATLLGLAWPLVRAIVATYEYPELIKNLSGTSLFAFSNRRLSATEALEKVIFRALPNRTAQIIASTVQRTTHLGQMTLDPNLGKGHVVALLIKKAYNDRNDAKKAHLVKQAGSVRIDLIDRPEPKPVTGSILAITRLDESAFKTEKSLIYPYEEPYDLKIFSHEGHDYMVLVLREKVKLFNLSDPTKPVKVFESPWFKDLHTVDVQGGKMLVVASGFDAMFEIDINSGKSREWFLWEQPGYERSPTGIHITRSWLKKMLYSIFRQRVLLATDAQWKPYGIPVSLRFHLNGAHYLPDGRIIATVAQAGEVIVLDPATLNIIQHPVQGLQTPHGFKPGHNGDIVGVNTQADLMMVLNSEFGLVRQYDFSGMLAAGKFKIWLQNASPLGDDLYVGVDDGRGQLVLVDPLAESYNSIELPREWRTQDVRMIEAPFVRPVTSALNADASGNSRLIHVAIEVASRGIWSKVISWVLHVFKRTSTASKQLPSEELPAAPFAIEPARHYQSQA